MKFHISDNFCTIYKLKLHQLQNFLVNHGHEPTEIPGDADIVISGVCAAFDADEARSIQLMKNSDRYHAEHAVIGYLVEVGPDKILGAKRYRTWEFDKLARDLTGVTCHQYDDLALPSVFRSVADYRVFDPTRRFVGVATGCGFDCSYCPHKLGAGPLRSRPAQAVLDDVTAAMEDGARIIHLTGLDTASYGADLGGDFGSLVLSVLGGVDDRAVFHIAQFNPEGINRPDAFDAMVKACSDSRVVDLQFPIQTGSARLLDLMRRAYSIETVRRFVRAVRQANPNIFLRTDVMLGFPTETPDDVEATIELVAALFDEAAVYTFENKAGTPIFEFAAEHELPREEKRARLSLVTERLEAAGLLVHSGGQRIQTLRAADAAKTSGTAACGAASRAGG